jgi:sulfur carrier protein ThiS
MKVLFINNSGGGFADHIEVEPGTTVTQLFEQRLPDARAEDYLIRVNRLPVSADQVLRDGDRVSMTPTKIHGADLAA